jgi:hypothetical protein
MFTTIRWYGRDNKELGIAPKEKKRIKSIDGALRDRRFMAVCCSKLVSLSCMITIHARCRLGTCVCRQVAYILSALCGKKKPRVQSSGSEFILPGESGKYYKHRGIRPTAAELLVGRLPRLPGPPKVPKGRKTRVALYVETPVRTLFLPARRVGERKKMFQSTWREFQFFYFGRSRKRKLY